MLTPLEQFNDEVITDLEKLIFQWHVDPKISYTDISKLFTQKLTEHKALILKKVIDEMPLAKLFDWEREQEDPHFLEGWNTYRQEFLNNLDTI